MAEPNSLVRVGIVMDVDKVKKRVRVYYPDLSNIVSDWLFVPQRPFHGDPEFAPFHVHATTGHGGEDGHTHKVNITYSDNTWLPQIDETVLVMYTYGKNTDGYVVGVIP